MPHASGIVIIDANTLRAFESEHAQERVRGNLRVADLELWVSSMNVLEALRNENPYVRRRLLVTLAKLSDNRAVLPWPMDLLKEVGLSLVRAESTTTFTGSPLDSLLREPESVSDDDVAFAKSFLEAQEAEFDRMHGEARQKLQPALRDLNALGHWPDIASFLDGQWMTPDLLAPLLDKVWESFGLQTPPPIDRVLQNEAWKLYFEGFGAAAFERGILERQPRRVQNADILQLVYLAGARRRILVTKDGGFNRLASAVLRSRYRDVAVIEPEGWLA